MTLRLLLAQARKEQDPMKEHEVLCFAQQSGLAREQITPFDLLENIPTLAQIKAYDALLVGGSGDFYVSKRNLPTHDAFLESLREIVDSGHPTFASCFGFQCLVEALGGDIIHDPTNTEVGTYEITLTKESEGDPLFGKLPHTFMAQLGHKDRAQANPPEIPNLARSELCPFQALRIPNKPIWATQFHPELNEATNRERFSRYLKGYTQTSVAEGRKPPGQEFHPSPEASSLLSSFVDVVFGS